MNTRMSIRNGMVSGNSVAVVGEEGVLVVDSGHFPSATRRIIGEIRSLAKAPVRYLVNTHWHGDHIRGNAVYREAFPAVSELPPTTLSRLSSVPRRMGRTPSEFCSRPLA